MLKNRANCLSSEWYTCCNYYLIYLSITLSKKETLTTSQIGGLGHFLSNHIARIVDTRSRIELHRFDDAFFGYVDFQSHLRHACLPPVRREKLKVAKTDASCIKWPFLMLLRAKLCSCKCTSCKVQLANYLVFT